MLYVTARDHRDAYTAHRAMTLDRGPDGGLFIPFRLPQCSPGEIEALSRMSFCRCTAEILNRFFGTRLTEYDVEFCAGKAPVRLKTFSHRIMLARMWYNPGWEFGWMARKLSRLMLSRYGVTVCSEWTYIAVRIAFLFGSVGKLLRDGAVKSGECVDISVVSGDFSVPMAAWYARRMGLPIGNIVCCCNENNSLWELMHQGMLRTNAIAVPTRIPEADIAVPASLERLIFACGGYPETARYLDICRRGGVYKPGEVLHSRLRTGLDVSVVSERRMLDVVRSVFSTYSCVIDPYTALAYAGLLDYRSRTGESRCALVLSDRSPATETALIAEAMGVTPDRVKELTEQL